MYSIPGYVSMIADRARMEPYVRALRQAVRPGAVVLDLGAGPGAFALLACRFGARRVYAIDPDNALQVARDLTAANGCTDRVEFIQKSFFDVDVSPATVVTLYLGRELNLRLRPKLQRELRPGSRIVSHEFDMGDWTPDKTVTIQGKDKVYRLMLWTVR